MTEDPSSYELDIANDLLDLLPDLLQQIRVTTPIEVASEQERPELHDINELRATNGQIRLLRLLNKRQRCTMQELADLLGVAAPTVTAMIKRMLTQGFVERVRDEQDWRVVWISPTERGLRAVTVYDQFRRANLQRRLALLNQEELALLRTALPVLHHLIEVKP
jgi:MarR family transcriptional regulator, organic hydroperoxide resistance regulator